MVENSLTYHEWQAMHQRHSLADGHAYYDPPKYLRQTVNKLPEIWRSTVRATVPEVQNEFLTQWAKITAEKNTKDFSCLVCPTASNSIDILAAALSARGFKVGLIEPSFDNLALLMRRRGVDVKPIPENCFHSDDFSSLKKEAFDAILIVDPNNPTGRSLSALKFRTLATHCTSNGIALLIDKTFRFFSQFEFEALTILHEESTSFVLIEDTGKTWPTLDLKLSPMFYSVEWSDILPDLYDEIFLCASPLTMAFFSELFRQAQNAQFRDTLKLLTGERRLKIRSAIDGSLLMVPNNCLNSRLPIEWLDCQKTNLCDLEFCHQLRESGVHLLPGRNFYWSNHSTRPTHFVRASLLKREVNFSESVVKLRTFLNCSGLPTDIWAA